MIFDEIMMDGLGDGMVQGLSYVIYLGSLLGLRAFSVSCRAITDHKAVFGYDITFGLRALSFSRRAISSLLLPYSLAQLRRRGPTM